MSKRKDALSSRDTIIVVGPGGVGKTTTAAALGIQGARMGKKTLVLTVDPAKRLATSLGMSEIGNKDTRVEPRLFAEAGIDLGSGALYAMMLDTKDTFDQIIERYAPNPAVRKRILDNSFYQQASTALAGSHEYMAMEKLYQIREDDDYDLLVLDTPPAANAMDFLSAPRRLTSFLDSGSLSILLAGARGAGRFSLGILNFNKLLLRVMSRFIGRDMFTGLIEFIQSFNEMFDGFKGRAQRVEEILTSEQVGFFVVSSPQRGALRQSLQLGKHLRDNGMTLGAFIVNRVSPRFLDPQITPDTVSQAFRHAIESAAGTDGLDEDGLAELAGRFTTCCENYHVMVEKDERNLAQLQADMAVQEDLLWRVPLFHEDIHDIATLSAFADQIFNSTPTENPPNS